jgi:hypothetical protein
MMMSTDGAPHDLMVEDYEPYPATFPPMTWVKVLEWLLAHAFPILVFPTEMVGGCVIPPRVRSTAELLVEKRRHCEDEGTYTIETGINGHGEEVAWVYDSGVPMEEWHEYQSGCELEAGDEEPDRNPWSHWPHCALGVRDRTEREGR